MNKEKEAFRDLDFAEWMIDAWYVMTSEEQDYYEKNLSQKSISEFSKENKDFLEKIDKRVEEEMKKEQKLDKNSIF